MVNGNFTRAGSRNYKMSLTEKKYRIYGLMLVDFENGGVNFNIRFFKYFLKVA